MASLEQLMSRTRLELSDMKEPFYETFTGSGAGNRFDLKKVSNVESLFLYAKADPSTLLVEGTDYTLDAKNGVVYFQDPPAAGEGYVAEGESSRYFSDEELKVFVETAFAMHTRGRGNMRYDALPAMEVLLVAILAQIEALWVLKASAAYDINVHAPEGMYIPRGQRFQQLNVLLQEIEARYKELSAALGVGLYAVEMFTLRRVSRTTGRYVPVYIDREFDDTRIPQRVFPAIGNQFEPQPESDVATYDLQVVQGRKFSKTFEMIEDDELFDLTSSDEFEVRLFRTPYMTHLFHHDVLPQFELTTNPNTEEVTISLTSEQTSRLHTTGSYRYSLIWKLPDEDVPLLEGSVLVSGTYPRKSPLIRVSP